MAAGIEIAARKPAVFKDLDPLLASHCYEGRSVREFVGTRVGVIGAGQSALESAALLHEAGAEVEVIAKIPQLRWIGMHPRLHQLGPISAVLYSSHDVGPAGISRLVAMPNVMKRVPLRLRDRIRTRAVRRAGAKWLPERLRKVRVAAGRTVIEAREFGDQVRMKLDDGTERSVHHVLMGTGYSVDIAKYDFIARDLLDRIKVLDGYLVLTSGLCSTVPGLHFVGATAARTFGPLLYVRSGHGIRVERSYFLHQAIREPNTMNVCRRRLRRCWHDEEGVFELDIGQSMPP
jgi:thioredoxin reductase